MESETQYGKLLEGWQQAFTAKGVPYYVNHKNQKTQWKHPILAKILEELDDFNNICYAAYRVALKLQFVQRKLSFENITLVTIENAFERQGLTCNADLVEHKEMIEVLLDIFTFTQKGLPMRASPEKLAEVTLSWLINLYDVEKTGGFKISSVKVGLAALSSAKLFEKYQYFFKVYSDAYEKMSRRSLEHLLDDIMQMPIEINDSRPFGGCSVAPAADSCFKGSYSREFLSKDVFMNWLVKDPQTILWLSTMHRLTAAESVKHDKKCAICRCYPIIGMRYRCLKCFNYDICQQCFLTGQINGKHKNKHPNKEYCLNTSSKDETKDFIKTVKNNILGKGHSKKLQYLPITESGSINEVEERPSTRVTPDVPEIKKENNGSLQDQIKSYSQTENTALESNHWRELDSIINHLENENVNLLHQLDAMQIPVSKPDNGDTEGDEDRHIAAVKREILEAHNQQLETQLKRLRLLMKNGRKNKQEVRTPFKTISQNSNLQPDQNKKELTKHASKELARGQKSASDMYETNICQEPSPISYNDISSMKRPSISGVSDDGTEELQRHTLTEEYQPERHADTDTFITPNNSVYEFQTFHPSKSNPGRPLERSPPPTYHFTSSFSAQPEPSPGGLSQLSNELTYGSLASLGRTHFTLPSPGPDLERYPDEEAQLGDILNLVTAEEEVHAGDFDDEINAEFGKIAKDIGHAMSSFAVTYVNDNNKVDESMMNFAEELVAGHPGNLTHDDTSIWNPDRTDISMVEKHKLNMMLHKENINLSSHC